MKKADVQASVRGTISALQSEATEYDAKARAARHSDREKDALYYEGVAQGYRLAAMVCDSRLTDMTR